ncbi:hypothetical protein BJ741DRAFT_603246 [Chytriomyces cf. hyalinus JEL632]|nr:hypothetical protein BJ741DRAFT_603246 [Chytriomyces cf. hyalinus JEL632]
MPSDSTTATTDCISISSLPLEILTRIIEYAGTNQCDLKDICAVNAHFVRAGRRVLHRVVKPHSTLSWAQFVFLLLAGERGSTSLGDGVGSFVQVVDLSGSFTDKYYGCLHADRNLPISQAMAHVRFPNWRRLRELITANEGLTVLEGRRSIFSDQFEDSITTQEDQDELQWLQGLQQYLHHRFQRFGLSNRDTSTAEWMLPVLHNPPKKVTAGSLIHLSRTCPNLKSLNLAHSALEPDTYFPELDQYQSMLLDVPDASLKRVFVSAADSILTLLRSCPRLLNLDLSGCAWVTLEVVDAIAEMKGHALRALNLCKCANIPAHLQKLFVVEESRELEMLLSKPASLQASS